MPLKQKTSFLHFSLLFLLELFLLFPLGPPLANEKLNVLLITIDSMRPDHLGCYGYPLPTTPVLDQFAKESLSFSQVISQASWTTPAMISILTSLYPPTHLVENRGDVLSDSFLTLADVFKKAGYSVPEICYLLKISNYYGLGFTPLPQKLNQIQDHRQRLLTWLNEIKEEPFFIWFHDKGPHLPYKSDLVFRKRFAEFEEIQIPSEPRFIEVQTRSIIVAGEFQWSPSDQEVIKSLYNAQLLEQDIFIRKILSCLQRNHLLDKTIVIITADHGEELLDHGDIGHCSTNLNGTLFNEVILVPLLIRFPDGLFKNRIFDQPVEAIDIAPTLLEVCNLKIPSTFQGKSLLKILKANKGKEYCLARTSSCGYQCFNDFEVKWHTMLLNGRYKFIISTIDQNSTFVLYDLNSDPKEKSSIATLKAEMVKKYKRKIERWQKKCFRLRKKCLTPEELKAGKIDLDTPPTVAQHILRAKYFEIKGDYNKALDELLLALKKIEEEKEKQFRSQVIKDIIRIKKLLQEKAIPTEYH